MSTQNNWLDKGVIALLVLLIVVDAALAVYVKIGIHYTRQDPMILYRVTGDTGVILPPDGFTAKKLKVEWPAKKPVGWAVRYASRICEFCSQDQPRWEQLTANLGNLGYKVVTIVPDAKDEYPGNAKALNGSPQITYINMGWIKRFRLSETPTLLLFDAHRGLIWSHMGTLASGDPSAAVRAAKSALDEGRKSDGKELSMLR